MNYYLFISFSFYTALMLCIGFYGYRNSTSDTKGYLLGGRNVGPKVTALSAGASDMSGWMLMGLPGAMFLLGFEALVIAMGLLIGAAINYVLVAPRLRVHTQVANDALTLPQFFANRFGGESDVLRLFTALIAIVFFTLYTAAGLVAGGKLFESVFQLPHAVGVLATISIVVIYTVLGGFLAVSISDFVQGSIMFLALALVPFVASQQFSNTSDISDIAIHSIVQSHGAFQDLGAWTLLSGLAWGLGYFGQPHILVRFMAIRSVSDIRSAMTIGISWMSFSLIGALATGFIGVAYVEKFGLSLSDPETIFIRFSEILFHPLVSGLLLSAILAAVMSTISSQLLVSSSSLTQDIYRVYFKHQRMPVSSVMLSRIAVLIVAACATSLALNPQNSVLSLVGNAWAGFGASFGPVVLFSLYWKKMSKAGAVAGLISGASVVLLWGNITSALPQFSFLSSLYEIVPAFIVASLSIYIVSIFTRKPQHSRIREMNQTQVILKHHLK